MAETWPPTKKKESIFFESQGYWLSKSKVKIFHMDFHAGPHTSLTVYDLFQKLINLREFKIIYSQVRNKSPGTLINFREKFQPWHVYSNHPVYLNVKHFPLTLFITDVFLRKIVKK